MISSINFLETPVSHMNGPEKTRRVKFTVHKNETTPDFATGRKMILTSLTKSTIRHHMTASKRKFGFLEPNSTFRLQSKRARSEETAKKPAKLQSLFEKDLFKSASKWGSNDVVKDNEVVLIDPELESCYGDLDEEAVCDRRTWDIVDNGSPMIPATDLSKVKPHIPNVFGASSPIIFPSPGKELDVSLESLPTTSRSPSPETLSTISDFNQTNLTMSPLCSDSSDSEFALSLQSEWSSVEESFSTLSEETIQGDEEDEITDAA